MIKQQLEEVREQIKEAALKANRDSQEITLIAVSKTYPTTAIEEAILNGCEDFGENHVQEHPERWKYPDMSGS